jgi:hypothetical protein
MDNENYQDVSLELGAIIKIISESNTILHNKYFLIDYLDNNQIMIINENKKEYKLTLKDGSLEDTSITQIIIVDRPQYKGFAKQNGMEIGTWWSIHFSFEGGEIIKGKIIGVEKDQIELQSPQYPDAPLTIDFQYKGIPKDLNIISIIRWNKEEEEEEEEEKEKKKEEDMGDYEDDELDGIIEELDDELIPDQIFDTKEIEDGLKDDLISADQIKIIKKDVVVTEIKQREEKDRVFDIEYQVDDLMDSLLSKIDENSRNIHIENKIHTTIDRYLQLRQRFSVFNTEDYIEGPILKTKEHKPLLNNLLDLKKQINWIVPVVKNRVELVDITNIADADDDVNPTTTEIDVGDLQEFQNTYINDVSPDGINKYLHIFGRTNSHLNLPVDFRKQDLILEEKVNDNYYTVVDNKDNFTSSAIKQITNFEICIDDGKSLPPDANVKCTDVKFQRQVYNNNMMVPFYDKKEGKNAIFKELIPSDKIALKGFIFFPGLVNYSKLLLKNTNIYNRSLLHFNHSRLFQIFETMREKQKFIGKNYIFNKEKKEFLHKHFLKNITNYTFQDQEDWADKSIQNNKDNYKEFLENIIPNTRDIIQDVYTDLSNNLNWQTSYQKLVDKLEPYMIYNTDIEFYHYIRLQDCLKHSIQKYYQDIGYAYQSLNFYYTDLKSYNVNSSFFEFFKGDNAFNNIDCKCYDFKETETSVEYLKKIIQIDNGCAFNNCVALNDVENINYQSIPDKIEQLKVEITNIQKNMTDGGDCTYNPKVLAKKFNSYESIRKDDNIDVYFDKKYDDTRYDILDEMAHLKYMEDKIKKKTVLKAHLINTIGLIDDDAERDSESMVNKKKKVIDGEYAMVDNGEFQFRYYQRKKKKWVLDDTLNDLSPEELNFVNCNFKNKCMTINNKCLDINDQKGKLQEELIAETIENLETEMIEEINTVKTRIEKEIKFNIENLSLLRKYKEYNNIRYDIQKVTLSNDIIMENEEKSPYIELRDNVLSDMDQVNKFNNIIKFVDNYCRTYSKQKQEDPNWFYCKKSEDDGIIKSYKLLPTFFYELAISYFDSNYDDVLRDIIDKRGKKSQEIADKYVDEHSGFVISQVENKLEERYAKSGQKIITHEVINTEEEQIIDTHMSLLKEETAVEKMGRDERMIKNLLITYDSNLRFNTGEKHEFMYQTVKYLINEYRMPKTMYDERTEAIRKEKNDSSYKRQPWRKYHHKFIFKSVLAIYILILQTAIPSYKQGKAIQPCIPSLKGYPIEKGDGLLEYIACSTYAVRVNNNEPPWDALKNVKKEKAASAAKKLMKEIKKLSDNYLLKNPEIIKMIADKKHYLEKQEKSPKVIQKRFNSWDTFLPPLIRITVRSIGKMGEGFDKKIYDSYQNNSNDSIVRLSKLKSKIDLFSIGVIEAMQRIVDKQSVILKTEDDIPFLENACCHEDNILTTYEYFITLDETIQKYNDQVIIYKKILQKHNNLYVPSNLVSLLNSRKEKSQRSYVFSESTIFLSFMKFCNFNTGIQLTTQLKQICDKNISEYTKLDTLADKIDILKSEGHNWNDEALRQLLLYVSTRDIEHQNYLNPDSSVIYDEAKTAKSTRSIFEDWVEASSRTEIYPKKLNDFLPLMKQLYDTYDVAQSSKETVDGKVVDFIEEVINQIHKITDKMKKNLLQKMKTIRNTKKSIRFIENLISFKERGEELFMSKIDETNYSLSQLLANMIKDMLITFPSLIKNESDRFSKKKIMKTFPKHWGFGSKKFSNSHKNKIISSIIPLNTLEKYACDDDCKSVIDKVLKNNKDILQFLDIIPFISNVEGSKTIFNGRINSSITMFLFYMTIELYYEIVEELVTNRYNVEDPEQESEYYGLLEQQQVMIANMMNTYFNIFKDTKKMLNTDPEVIKNNVLKQKEIEKEDIKNQFNTLDDEHRKIEREMKSLKLGEWSVGLSKSIFQYDPAMYDREIQNQERLTQLMNENNVTLSALEGNNTDNMFTPLSGAATDLLIQQEQQQEIYDERYGMMDNLGDYEDMDSRDDLY